MFEAGHSSEDYEQQTVHTPPCDVLYVVVELIVTAVVAFKVALVLLVSIVRSNTSQK